MKLIRPTRWNSSYRYFVGDVVLARVPYTGPDVNRYIDLRPTVLVSRPERPYGLWGVATLTLQAGHGRYRVRANSRNGLEQNGYLWSTELSWLSVDDLRQPLGMVDAQLAEAIIVNCGLDHDRARLLREAAVLEVRWAA